MGTPTAAAQTNVPSPPAAPDQLNALIQGRRAALRSIAAKRGLQSTFLTTPPQGSLLGGGP
ncbi:MAG: hypothetical protein JST54_12565 [Deltaproteobacteria bacterium]|nr:hypothetical protein [Deltaproteobacteria bacterium]